jgi:hypothetical protein
MRGFKSKRESTEANERCTTFRISQFAESSHHRNSSGQLPFQDKKNRLHIISSKSLLKSSAKRIQPAITRNQRQTPTALLALTKLIRLSSSQEIEIILREIEVARRRKLVKEYNQSDTLQQIFVISERMHDEVYSYRQVEDDIKELHGLIKKLGSATLAYRAFAFSGFALYEYGSYSLALYYFDRALKSFYDRDSSTTFEFERRIELQLYKFVCRIFLVKCRYV